MCLCCYGRSHVVCIVLTLWLVLLCHVWFIYIMCFSESSIPLQSRHLLFFWLFLSFIFKKNFYPNVFFFRILTICVSLFRCLLYNHIMTVHLLLLYLPLKFAAESVPIAFLSNMFSCLAFFYFIIITIVVVFAVAIILYAILSVFFI